MFVLISGLFLKRVHKSTHFDVFSFSVHSDEDLNIIVYVIECRHIMQMLSVNLFKTNLIIGITTSN